jgi:hypothetical protein
MGNPISLVLDCADPLRIDAGDPEGNEFCLV